MFVITPVSALHSYTYPLDPYLAQQRARTEARIRWHNQEQLRKQLILGALHAQGYGEYHNTAFYDYDYNSVCPPKGHCPAFAYDAAIQKARRQALLEQAAREREPRYQGFKRFAALKAQHEEQELHARRCADAERLLNLLLNQQPPEILTQPIASTSTVVQDEPSLKHRLEERLMTEDRPDVRDVLQSLLSSVSGGNSSEVPVEHIPVVSTAADPSVPKQESGIAAPPSQGKGKDKEISHSDEPSPARIASSLSQISSIASHLETLLTDFQFPAELDFSPERSPSPSYSALDTDGEFALTYTPTNAPLRAQEHALSLILSELDNIPSFGSCVVKDARRAVVARVEEALEELEKCVEERRGRVRARKADLVTVSVESVQAHNSQSTLVEPVAHPMDVETEVSPSESGSADLAPFLVSIDVVPSKVSMSVNVPAMDVSAEGSVEVPVEALASTPMELFDHAILDSSETTTIEAPTSIPVVIELTSASVTERSVASSISPPASLPITPCVSETLAARVLVPQDGPQREFEELLVNAVSPVSEKVAGEDTVIIEQAENAHSPAQMELEPSSYVLRPVANADTSDSVPDSVSAAIPDSIHMYPVEVVNMTDVPTFYSPTTFSSAYEEQNVSGSHSVIESPAYSSPLSEREVDTFLLPASHPASPRLAPHDSEDEDGVVVGHELEIEHMNEDEWSDVEA